LDEYARRTAAGYCAGCAEICESAVKQDIPIVDIMRHSMYRHAYGDRDQARRFFSRLPARVKANLIAADYAAAEGRCPQQVPIGQILKSVYTDIC
jgi:hypothetical protein